MPMTSQKFTYLIRQKNTIGEFLKLKLLGKCPHCNRKVQERLNLIQDSLEDGCEMLVVIP